MKYFALIVLVAIAQPVLPLPRQTINKQAKNATANTQAANQQQAAANPPTSITVINNSADKNDHAGNGSNEADNVHPEIQKQSEAWSRTEIFTLAYDILTFFLVIIALGTGIAVACQAIKTADATKAMRESTDLQKAAMEQWINVETRSASVMGGATNREIGFHFQCINNTEYPLTIKKIVTEVGILANEWHKSTVETDTTLAPYAKGKAKYSFYSILKGAEERIKEFEKGSAIYTINGEVSYIDCLRRNRTQGFSGLYRASADVFECLEPYGTVPTYEKRVEDMSRWNTFLHNDKKTEEGA